jgi:hypothetical protein
MHRIAIELCGDVNRLISDFHDPASPPPKGTFQTLLLLASQLAVTMGEVTTCRPFFML